MFYAQHAEPMKPKQLPWYGRWSNCLLILLTTIFMLLGLGLAAVGAVMLALNKVFSRDEVKELLNETQFNGNLKVGNVINSLPLLTICVGGVVFFLGIFACIGRGYKSRICLVMSSVFILWFIIVQTLTCAMWVVMRDKFENNVKSDMQTLFEQYEGVSSDTTKGWDLLHLGFDCCSLNVITFTANDYTFNVTQWWGSRTSELDLVPASCCSDATEDNYKTYTDSDCERILLSHNKKSCYDEMISWMKYFWTPAIIISAALIAIEALLIFLPCVLCCGVHQSREIKY